MIGVTGVARGAPEGLRWEFFQPAVSARTTPGDVIFAITDAVAQPGRGGQLLDLLATVPDPGDPRGVRYRLAGMLAVAVSAVLTGARSFAAIGEWAAELTGDHLCQLGLGAAPEESTLRKLFARLDADALDRVLGAWWWTRTSVVDGRRVIAIDGKTVRGARTRPDAAAPHLVAAFDHAAGVVLGQLAVAAKSNEIPCLRDLLACFDLTAVVVTLDAMHTQADTATAITSRSGHYVLTIKGDTPTLRRQFKALPWKDVPAHSVTETGHGKRTPRPQGRDRPGLGRVPWRGPDRAGPPHRHHERQEDRRGRLPDHLRRPEHRTPSDPRRMGPRPLVDREQAPPRAGRDARRGRLPGPHRPSAPGHGNPTQHRHQPAASGRLAQHRQSSTTPRPEPRPSPDTPADLLRRDLSGALGARRQAHCSGGACMLHSTFAVHAAAAAQASS
ncbi:MAG: ISAs1 family transposase [Dermatophilaceae bacterium]